MSFPASLDALLLATAALAVAGGSLTAFGLGRVCYAGWRWWMAAMWLTTLGALLGAVLPEPWGAAAATPLLLQWPVVTLIGLRRFHARLDWPASERSDGLALVVLGAVAAAASLLPAAEPAQWTVAACSMAAHLYAVAVLLAGPGDREGTPLRGLAAAIAVAAFAPGLTVLLPYDAVPPLAARAMAAALGAIALAFVALTLVCDRTERQLRDSRRRLRELANVDALTQVPNRRHFHELASHALRRDPPGSGVLLLFDVDHFKQINDHFGHAAGDRALCLVAASVVEHLRAADVAGRHGGDEFVLLLRSATTAHAMGVAARVAADIQHRAAVQQLPPLTLSFGMVQVKPGELLDAAMRRADQALYEAKRQGRSRAVAAQGGEDEPVFSESQRLGLTAH